MKAKPGQYGLMAGVMSGSGKKQSATKEVPFANKRKKFGLNLKKVKKES